MDNTYMKQIEKNVERLLKSDISGYEIYKQTGINRSAVSRLRRGITTIETTNWKTIRELNNYAEKIFNKDKK